MALTTVTDQGNTTRNGNGRRSLVDRLVDANASGARPILGGLVPYLTKEGTSILEQELQGVVRLVISRTLQLADEDVTDAISGPIATDVRNKLAAALDNEYNRDIPGTSLSLVKIRESYKTVVAGLLDEYVRTASTQHSPVRLPDEVIDKIRSGELFATEDFRDYIAQNRVAFISEVSKLRPEVISNNPLVSQQFERFAILEFQKIFKGVNVALLHKLGLRLPGESDSDLSDRIDRHQMEAVAFLEQVHQAAEEFQRHRLAEWYDMDHNARSSTPPAILSAHKPKDIAFKRLSDIAELLFYPNKYPIGAQRRYVAQQILVLTLIYQYIERYPPFKAKIESARKLHDDLNLALEGREGRRVPHVYIDKDGNKSLVQDDRFCSLYDGEGVREFKLLPRVIATTAGAVTLFANGQQVGIDSRCKTASSTLLKLLNKGNINEITDLLGFDFVIDSREMDHETLCRVILELKAYIKDVWGVTSFVEDYTGITDPAAASNSNVSTSKKFINEKVIFFHLVDGVQVPVEVQFKTLEMKLKAENKSGPASHKRYRLKQAVEGEGFKELFPDSVFGGFSSIAAQVEHNVQDKIVEKEVYESRA